MDRQLRWSCDIHDDLWDCPDVLVVHTPKFREYGIPVRDGLDSTAPSKVTIQFCPWCGAEFPPSMRDVWFAELERLGIDPAEDEVPAEFHSQEWLVRRGL